MTTYLDFILQMVKEIENVGSVYDWLTGPAGWTKEELGPKWLFKAECWLYGL